MDETTLSQIFEFIQEHPGCGSGQISSDLMIMKDVVNDMLYILVSNGDVRKEWGGFHTGFWAVETN